MPDLGENSLLRLIQTDSGKGSFDSAKRLASEPSCSAQDDTAVLKFYSG